MKDTNWSFGHGVGMRKESCRSELAEGFLHWQRVGNQEARTEEVFGVVRATSIEQRLILTTEEYRFQ